MGGRLATTQPVGTRVDVSPIPAHAFFEESAFQSEIGDDLLQRPRRTPESFTSTSSDVTARAVSPEPAFAGLQELFRPAVIFEAAIP
jgi:hypothetical protein